MPSEVRVMGVRDAMALSRSYALQPPGDNETHRLLAVLICMVTNIFSTGQKITPDQITRSAAATDPKKDITLDDIHAAARRFMKVG